MPVNTTPNQAVTLKQIAEWCGVNVMTVSLALRNVPGRVKAETRERVLEAARVLGYNPALTHAARSLRLRGSGQRVTNQLIAMLINHATLERRYEHILFEGVMEALVAHDYGIVTFFTEAISDQDIPSLLQRGDVDGLLTIRQAGQVRAMLSAHGIPKTFPIVGLCVGSPGEACVDTDYVDGHYQATRHLLGLGHRHLLHFHRSATNTYLEGMRRAYAEIGLNAEAYLHVCAEWYPYMKNHDDLEWQWQAMASAFRAHPTITAIMAPNDFVAVRLHDALRLHHLRVPDDISLIGYDDTHAVRNARRQNILTTVQTPLNKISHEAVRLLLEINDGRVAPDTHWTLPAKLIVRASTAPPRSSGPLTVK